ncbi:MAG: hypothetical protein KDA61_17965, partial [Planctomycetales bacterium]|nr:hypothetical protein [Planctomycetales bacterium]
MSRLRLRYELARVASRRRKVRFWAYITAIFVAMAAVLWLWRRSHPADLAEWRFELALWSAAAACGMLVAQRLCRRREDELRAVARSLETRFPGLDSRLAAAVEQVPLPHAEQLGYLQDSVVRQAVAHRRSHDWMAGTTGRLVAARFGGASGMVACLALLLGVWRPLPSVQHEVETALAVTNARELTCVVEPGDAEIERGSSLVALAHFTGGAPVDATLLYRPTNPDVLPLPKDRGDASSESPRDDDGASWERLAMTRSLDDPIFARRLDAIPWDLTYAVEYGGVLTETYRIRVFDFPKVEQIDATIEYPDYARRSPREVHDTRRVTALEGSRIDFSVRVNKPLAVVRFVNEDAQIDLSHDAEDPCLYRGSLVADASYRFRVRLGDVEGRENRDPPELVVRMLRNAPPKITLRRPGRDVSVSALEELDVLAEIAEDVALESAGIAYRLGDDEERVEILEPTDATPPSVSHRIDLERLQARPDQLLTYYVWAEDRDAQGETRRVTSDIFFAEVRPFEEIFRQGDEAAAEQQRQQQQQQGQQGAAQSAMELAEMQKQVIAATWKLATRLEPDEFFDEDVQTVIDAQQQAVEMASALVEELDDVQSQMLLTEAIAAMGDALTSLQSFDQGNRQALRDALQPERNAYQSLLRLRDREHTVVQGQPGSPSSSSGQAGRPSDRQLEQLELKEDRPRYEDESTADAAAEDPQQAEARQALNRLRELARRQSDLNEQLKQLEIELQRETDPQRREDLDEQLKRLREEQEEILRDADELQQRMEQEQNEQASDATRDNAQQRMQETRDQIRETTEALRQGQVGQAVAEGRRAQESLEQL